MSDADFELSLALDSMTFGTDCPAEVKGEAVSEDVRSDDAVEVKVSRRLCMRQVADTIIALNRLKHRQMLMGTNCVDNKLLIGMMESLLEDTMSDADFELSLALDSMTFGTDCPAEVKGEAVSEDVRSDDAVEVKVSRRPCMRQVADTIIALNRLKHWQMLMGTDCVDNKLLIGMMESLLEAGAIQSHQTFVRDKTYVYSVTDREKRTLVRADKLHAEGRLAMSVRDKEYYQTIVKLSLSTYMAFYCTGNRGQVVTLGIANTNSYMFCSMESGSERAILRLKRVDQDLTEIASQEEKASFLFFKRREGLSRITFESVKFRGWYICTEPASEPASEPAFEAPLAMCTMQEQGNRTITFMLRLE
ncbi:interleukin-1 beta isoform X2 [Anguilla rostrata]|uniref:interleukin-1 beta isoform X2 n=1 Tax=Anguilla rostrata TaxID=7938 RepID=UPI0030D0F858